MWYRTAQGIGGGVIGPGEKSIGQPAVNSIPAEEWDKAVNLKDHIGNPPHEPPLDDQGTPINDGPGVEAQQARRLSPLHSNPEETTMEEQLEAVRHENVNHEPLDQQSMSSTEGARGQQTIRGEYQSHGGRDWAGFKNSPGDVSWA